MTLNNLGLYLNKWTPDFDPTQDIPSAIPVMKSTQTNIETQFKHGDLFHIGEGGGNPRCH